MEAGEGNHAGGEGGAREGQHAGEGKQAAGGRNGARRSRNRSRSTQSRGRPRSGWYTGEGKGIETRGRPEQWCHRQRRQHTPETETELMGVVRSRETKGMEENRAILHDVIDIDDGGGSEDLVIIGEKVSKSKKGKTIEAIHQVVEVSDYTFIQPGVEDFGPAILHDVIDIDDDDDSDDLVIIGEKVSKSNNGKTIEAIHQVVTHLDNVDIPPETEAPFTWLSEYDLGLKKSTFKNSPWYDTQSDAKKSHATDFSQLSWSLEPSNSKIQGSTLGSSNLQIKMDNVDHSCGTELSSSQLFSQTAPNKKKLAASQRNRCGLNLSLGVESSKSKRFLKSFRSKMKSASFGSKHHGLAGNSEARNLLPPAAIKFMNQAASSSSHHAIMRKFRNFKQFDSVRDASGHHFICENSSMKQHPKNWVKVIQKEWKILEKDLPDSIFVRVYESRMDLLRAVIVGAEGTPYHNGLFFFDLYFPSGYPNVPPLVYSHSSNDRLNPVFKYTGRLCLSLLNTWSGNKNECWLPRISTILQVLVSIQGLVLNAKPFFNHAAGEALRNYIADVESISLLYNENAFTHSLEIMSYTMSRPPKYFEDFVVGHFVSRAHDILGACNAYIEGAQVGSLVKDEAQNEWRLMSSVWCVGFVRVFMNRLVIEFSRIGAKDCEKFLSAAIIKEGQHIYQFYEAIDYAQI